MAFIKCSGGGKLKETILWENPKPTSNFAAQTIMLSQDMNNFDYLAFNIRAITIREYQMKMIYPVIDVKNSNNTGGSYDNTVRWCTSPGFTYSGNPYMRGIYYVSDTSIRINDAYPIASTLTTQNSYAIPISVIGMKY